MPRTKRSSIKRKSEIFEDAEKKTKAEGIVNENGSSDKETRRSRAEKTVANRIKHDEPSDDSDSEHQSKGSSKKKRPKKSLSLESDENGTPEKVDENDDEWEKIKSSGKKGDNFSERRKFILNKKDPPSALEVKNKYPSLFHAGKVLAEFEHIMKKKYIFESFKRNVSRYYEGIWKLVSSPIKVKVQSYMKDADEMTKMWMKKVASLLLISEYLDDDRKGIMIFDYEDVPQDHQNRPYIKCLGDLQYGHEHASSFVIYVEDTELCNASNMVEAYFSLLAAYYIFNAVYPSCCENTFYFLEKYYLEYTDNYTLVNKKAKKRMDALIAGSVEKEE